MFFVVNYNVFYTYVILENTGNEKQKVVFYSIFLNVEKL